ncbi:ERF family protein, partial [Escherichia coli]|uniref:ERF family protein n=1 Tax=Escherichia coli TaxID=562 RepID=UPI0039DF5A00
MNAQTNISAAPGTTHSTLIGALAAGLAEVEGAIKDAQNPHLKNKYADLASVIAAIKPVARHGLWFRQVTKPDDAGARI